MRTLKVENGDLVIDDKKRFTLVGGTEEKRQSVERILSTNTGEWFLNLLLGFDYKLLQTKQYNYDDIRDGIIEALRYDERIDDVYDFTFDLVDRHLTVTFKVSIDSEEIEVSL